MKTCLIYGHNGLDLDVTLNLRVFYKKIGFKVFFSENLHCADLLVVLRAVDKAINLVPYNFSVIHVFDYGGWDYDAFVKSLDTKKSFIFCSSETKMNRIVEELNFPPQKIFVALPPVEVELWSLNLKPIAYNLIHIGNFKAISTDSYSILFANVIRKLNVNIWGLGWKITELLTEDLFHGKLGLFNVSEIYAKSSYALGLMYPFQRYTTFSGRFWHGPLNGCTIISESGLFTNKIPGVIETDYTFEDINAKINNDTDRQKIKIEATLFWELQKKYTLDIINITLENLESDSFSISKYLTYCRINTYGLLRIFYQRQSLFKFFKKKYN